jgi:hypothetical protein
MNFMHVAHVRADRRAVMMTLALGQYLQVHKLHIVNVGSSHCELYACGTCSG